MTDFENIKRPVVPEMEDRLNAPIPVLDHGFVRLVDYMGDDQAIVQAARVSYGQGTKHGSSNEGLIRYLMRHWHSTPFEMCEIKLHVKLPVFVARQWIRHRTANVNEYSARYSILEREFYIPDIAQMQAQSTTNAQGREEALDADQAAVFQSYLRGDAERAYEHYEEMVGAGIYEGDGKQNLARELARMNLPTNIYTQWYWKVDLHNLLHFLRLRADPHAQWEIRQYANAICEIVEEWVPLAWQAFVDYRLKAEQFSSQEMEALRELIWSNKITDAEIADAIHQQGAGKREIDDFRKKLSVIE